MTDTAGAPTTGDLQFDKAEFVAPQSLICRACQNPIRDAYYTANAVTLCISCRERLGNGRAPLTVAAVAKASLFGFGAAIVGAVVWGGITQATGYNIGFVAVVVGVLIGNAVRKNGGQSGGWAFQTIAVAMTYICIALSYMPSLMKNVAYPAWTNSGQDFLYLLQVALRLIGQPSLVIFPSPMGALINGFAFYEAWKLTKRTPIKFVGPLQVNPIVEVPAATPEVPAGG